jgi:hypothetical protein
MLMKEYQKYEAIDALWKVLFYALLVFSQFRLQQDK